MAKLFDNNAKGRIRKSLFVVVLSRPFHAQSNLILFVGVGQFPCLFVEVAVVAVVFCWLCQER